MENLKVGDVELLKSGGPTMTVSDIYEGGDGWYGLCDWFVKGESKQQAFKLTTLKIAGQEYAVL